MASYPDLSPSSIIPRLVLPATGSTSDVSNALVYGVWADSEQFITGAASQVAYVYRRLGADVLDAEITANDVYAAYEDACLEYSYLINLYHGRNVLSSVMGHTTASFGYNGEATSGETIESKSPRFMFGYARKISYGFAQQAGFGGTQDIYSASISLVEGQQDYDLQTILEEQSLNDTTCPYYGLVGENRCTITKVYYQTPLSHWRFFAYYGALGVLGNLSNYGQWADDTTWQVIPVWQNKLQAMAYSDALYTRFSHFSYMLKNNKLRLFPTPMAYYPAHIWFEFYIQLDPWEEGDTEEGINGINNLHNIPMANLPYENINAVGKHWIRRFCLALCKETLGDVREKIDALPIPGDSVRLNGSALKQEANDMKEKLREELKEMLDQTNYENMIERDADIAENVKRVWTGVPNMIYKG